MEYFLLTLLENLIFSTFRLFVWEGKTDRRQKRGQKKLEISMSRSIPLASRQIRVFVNPTSGKVRVALQARSTSGKVLSVSFEAEKHTLPI
jgi:hypothetical protein